MQPPEPAASQASAPWKGGGRILVATLGFLFVRFLLTPVRIKVLTNLLSKEEYGAITVIASTVAFLVIATSFGGFEFMMRRLPGIARAAQFGILKGLMKFATGFLLLLGVIGAAWLSVRPPEKILLTPQGAFVCAGLLLCSGLLVQRSFFLMACGAYVRARLLQVMQSDLWFVPLAVLAAGYGHEPTMTSALLAWALWLLAVTVLTQGWAPLRETWRAVAPPRFPRELLAFGLPLLPMVLGDWLFRLIDQYVVLAQRSAGELASYALAVNTAMVGYLAGTASLDVLGTEFNRQRNLAGSAPDPRSYSERPGLRRTFNTMLRHAFAVGLPLMAALWLLGRPVVLALSQEKFLDAVPILAWASFQPLLFMLNLIFGRVLVSFDRRKRVGAGTLASAALALALNLLLVPSMGGRGAALGIALALAALTVFLGSQLGVARWLDAKTLMPGRLLVLAAASFGGLYLVGTRLAGAHPWLALGAGGAWCAAVLGALGLIRIADFRPHDDGPDPAGS